MASWFDVRKAEFPNFSCLSECFADQNFKLGNCHNYCFFIICKNSPRLLLYKKKN